MSSLLSAIGITTANRVPIDEDWDKADSKAIPMKVLSNTIAGKRSVSKGSVLPPQINATFSVRTRMMFTNAGNTALTSVTPNSLAGSLGGVVSVVNSTFIPWASTVRLKRVRIWPPANTSAVPSCELFWASGLTPFVKDEVKIRALPESVTDTGVCTFVPPKKALASDWVATTNTSNIFTMAAAAGAVVEVETMFTLSNALQSTPITIASGVLGTIYYLSLDSVATHRYTPLGVPTTF